MTTRQNIEWSVFDLVTNQAAYSPKTFLERHETKKTICTRSGNVKILANKNGWPGAAEEALSYANPTTSEN